MYKKFLSVFLCLLLCVSLSAPRVAATGAGGFVATNQTLGFIGSLLGSLGIVFDNANDMNKGVQAYVDYVTDDPISDFWQSWQDQVYIDAASKLVIPAATFQRFFPDLFRSVLDYFAPGTEISTSPDGAVIGISGVYVGMPPAWISDPSSLGVDLLPVTGARLSFADDNGSHLAYAFCGSGSGSWRYSYTLTVSPDGYEGQNMANYEPIAIFFSLQNSESLRAYIVHHTNNRYGCIGFGDFRISGPIRDGELQSESILVYQQPGAFGNDLIGGVWDKLGQDAASGNGAVVIDTNLPAYQGAATGMIGGDPDTNIAAPQDSTLQGIGATHTETDAETGTQTSTQVQTGTQAVPNSTTANPAISQVQTQTTFNGVALTLADIFPFCIPFDIYAMLTSLAASRETPTFDVRLYYPGWLDYTYTFEFSDWDNVAAVLRAAELGAFVIGLAAATRKFIKW